MDRSFDLLIGKLLKNWTARHRPPADVRARLLWDAARQTPRPTYQLPLLPRPQFEHPSIQATDQWSQTLFLWVNEHSLQAGMPVRLT